jgi:L-fucose isomerase-like protein
MTATAQTRLEARALLKDDDKVDGYVVYMIGIFTDWPISAPEAIASWGKPTVFVDDLYGGSGEFLIANAAVRRKGYNVLGVSSSNFDDVVEAVRYFECIKKLKCSSIIEVGGGPAYYMHVSSELVAEKLGTKIIEMEYEPLHEAYTKVDPVRAAQLAERWMKEAEKIVEPSKDEIVKSAAMYYAMCEMLREHNAQAITINCLGGFREQKIKAYPCLGFFQLDNDGSVGACEGDSCCTLTKLIMKYLVGRPGFISDPVIDTAKNQIIYAHCVGMNKVFGPDGPANPYHIRSHAEDNKGAAVRSLMPIGEMVTTVKFDPRKDQVILHQGKTVANIDEDKACRTKVAVEVKGDIDKLFNYWDQWLWHRVTFFGDHKKQVKNLAALLGMEVIEEA